MSAAAPTRIVVLGGGFAGIYAVMELEKRLGRDGEVEITLVNKDNFFVFTPMLHEVAASDLDLTHIVNPIRKLLRRAAFFHGEVLEIDLEHRAVVVTHGVEGSHPHRLETKVKGFSAEGVELTDGTMIETANLVWTAGSTPNPLLTQVACAKERGRVVVDEFLPGVSRGWRTRSRPPHGPRRCALPREPCHVRHRTMAAGAAG